MSEEHTDRRSRPLKSQRYESSRWQRVMVLIVFVLLALGVLLTLAVIILSVFGLTPGA